MVGVVLVVCVVLVVGVVLGVEDFDVVGVVLGVEDFDVVVEAVVLGGAQRAQQSVFEGPLHKLGNWTNASAQFRLPLMNLPCLSPYKHDSKRIKKYFIIP